MGVADFVGTAAARVVGCALQVGVAAAEGVADVVATLPVGVSGCVDGGTGVGVGVQATDWTPAPLKQITHAGSLTQKRGRRGRPRLLTTSAVYHGR